MRTFSVEIGSPDPFKNTPTLPSTRAVCLIRRYSTSYSFSAVLRVRLDGFGIHIRWFQTGLNETRIRPKRLMPSSTVFLDPNQVAEIGLPPHVLEVENHHGCQCDQESE